MRNILFITILCLAMASLVSSLYPVLEVQAELSVLTFFVCLISASYSSPTQINPVSLMCITTGIFLYGRFLVSYIFGHNDYMTADWFIYGPIESNILSSSLSAVSLFLCGITLGAGKIGSIQISHDLILGKFALFSAAIFMPFTIYRIYTNLEFFSTGDYLNLYLNGGPGDLPYTLGGWIIVSLTAFISSKPNIKYSIVAFILGILFCLSETLKGARGIALAQIVVLSWLFMVSQNLRLSGLKMLVFGFILIFFSEYIGRLRIGNSTEEMAISGITNGFLDFFYSQGTSLLFVVATNQNLSKFSILDGFQSTFALFFDGLAKLLNLLPDGQNADFAAATSSLSHRIAYMVNSDMYLSGMGMGGSAVAESMLYFSTFGPLIAGLFTGIFINFLCRYASGSAKRLFILAATLPFILLIPRETQLYFLIPFLKAIFFLVIMKFLVKQYNGQQS